MVQKLFGTDGIRGLANVEPLTPHTITQIGRAVATFTGDGSRKSNCIVVGRDTRRSCDMIESALIAGICSVGVDVYSAGVLPTPSIPEIAAHYNAFAGIMITASHNPYGDNGLKIFGPDGCKLSRTKESLIAEAVTREIRSNATGFRIGCVTHLEHADRVYAKRIARSTQDLASLKGLRIALDCANGAGSYVGPLVLRNQGLSIQAIHDRPNGTNINHYCGAMHLDAVAGVVRSGDADIGIALDGDADRCILIDEKGQIVDGDHVLAILGKHLAERGELANNTVVATVMSNVGLDASLAEYGIKVARSAVGDRFVAEKMREVGASLGGEKSGHTIIGKRASVGDGLATALAILEVMGSTGKSLSELRSVMVEYPQHMINVPVRYKVPIENLTKTQAAIIEAREAIGDFGTVLVRYSGTENLARIMVQGKDGECVTAHAEAIANLLKLETPGVE